MKLNSSVAGGLGALALALWSAGCAMATAEEEPAGAGEGEGEAEAERAVTSSLDAVVRRYVPAAFYAEPAGLTGTSAQTEWSTAFAIHNTSSGPQQIRVVAFGDNGAEHTCVPFTLPAYGARSFRLDGCVPAGFRGAAAIEGQAAFEVTAIELPMREPIANRPLMNAATPARAIHFPTIMRNVGGRSTKLFLHNASASADIIHLKLHDPSGSQLCEAYHSFEPHMSRHYDLASGLADCLDGDYAPVPLPSSWLGTLTVESGAASGQITGSAMLVDAAGPRVSGLEGSRGGPAPTFPLVYRSYGASSITSSLALQNLADTATSFRLRFFSTVTGAQVTDCFGQIPGRGRTVIATNTALCNLPAGFIGSALYLGDGRPVAAATTVTRDDGGSSFEGVSSANHAGEGVGSRLSLPFVRWTQSVSDTTPNTYIAVQNVGSASVEVDVTYRNAAGSAWSHRLTILPGQKKSSTPADVGITELGYSPFGAAAIVEVVGGTGNIGAAARVVGTTAAEDYPGVAF